MKKIKITSNQYNRLLLHEQQSRSKFKILNEGSKEVVLGVSMLMGLNLSGLNKEMAEKALNDEKVMSEIFTTLEDENKIKELISNLEEKGMVNAQEKLASKAKDIINNYNEISEKNNMNKKMGLVIMNLLMSK